MGYFKVFLRVESALLPRETCPVMAAPPWPTLLAPMGRALRLLGKK